MHYRPAWDKLSAAHSSSALAKSHLRLILLSFAIIALLPAISLAQQATLTDDAYTSNTKNNRNFGSDEKLILTATGERDFLKFKLTPNLPTGTVGNYIGKATLKLFIENVNAPGAVEVHAVSATWSEATITDSTAPPLGPVLATVNITTDQAGKWVTVDLTQSVKDWLDGVASNNGIALVAAGGTDITFNSKENRQTSHEPRLEIILNHATTADQATTATTATSATTATTANTISGVLPTNKGGTGLSAAGAAGNVLVSNGTAWTSSPLSASGLANSFIQNQNSVAQTANFSITGNGTAGGTLSGNVVNAATQFNLGGNRFLSAQGNVGNIFMGFGAGQNDQPTPPGNGLGNENTFVGDIAGQNNTSGFRNAFFGRFAGHANTSGGRNAFFGYSAGANSTTGFENSFFGQGAGELNNTGNRNTFIGFDTGGINAAGSNNTAIGALADIRDVTNLANQLNFATAIGANSSVHTSDTIVLGKVAGTYNGVARPADTVQIPGDLNVAGSLSLNIVNATTQYNLGGSRFLSSNLSLENTSLGQNAGPVNTGAYNSFFGTSAGAANTTGQFNSFFGRRAGVANTTGGANAFFGDNAGGSNVGGSRNSYFGSGSGFTNVSGADNSFFGYHAGIVNTVSNNSFFGSFAGASNSTGDYNAFFGVAAGQHNTTAGNNSFFGSFAGSNNQTGASNSFFGYQAGGFNTTQGRNTFVGHQAGLYNGQGDSTNLAVRNTYVGAGAGYNNKTGGNNSFFGDSTGYLNDGGSYNVFLGAQAGSNNTTGSRNTIAGFNSGGGCDVGPCGFTLTGNDNSFFGYLAGKTSSTGQFNSFFGSNAGVNNQNGNENSYFGFQAGYSNQVGVANSFFGSRAGYKNTAFSNSFFGAESGQNNTSGGANSFFGTDAGVSNVSGSFNGFFGFEAGSTNDAGSNNNFFGRLAGASNTGGSYNSFFGERAGQTNTTGGNNTLVGANADVGANNLTNATAIGANAQVTQSNSLVLGSINGVGGATADTNVGIGTTAPTSRLTVAGLIETTAGGVKFPDGTIQTTAASGGTATTDNTTLTGNGTAASPLTIKGGGVGTAQLADSSVTAAKIASGQVVKTLNGLTDNVTLAAGSNVTITPSGNTLTISASGGGGGSGSFIQNQTTQQTSANFNIDGTGQASIFDAATQYNIGGNRVLSIAGTQNIFVGRSAGVVNTTGNANSFVGDNAGGLNTTGYYNSFFGTSSGYNNTGGTNNSFFGTFAGLNNTTGTQNTFVGFNAGQSNVDGYSNSFVGASAGLLNTSGFGNSFVGINSGEFNTTGTQNSFFGNHAGQSNTTGNYNSTLGFAADVGSGNLSFATAIGAGAIVNTSNTIVLGRSTESVVIPGNLTVQGTFTNLSDIRLKTGVNSLGYGLSELMRLRPVTWTWKNSSDGHTQLGLIAQDVKPVLPELVLQGTDKDHTLSLNYIGLLPVVIRAIQEQQATIASLKNEISSLQKEKAGAANQTIEFVESTGMTNVCNGNVMTDGKGEATVILPDGFKAQTRDFRYQLTVIGQFAQAIISSEIKDNHFTIKTDKPRVKVSWQVTGVRRPASAQ